MLVRGRIYIDFKLSVDTQTVETAKRRVSQMDPWEIIERCFPASKPQAFLGWLNCEKEKSCPDAKTAMTKAGSCKNTELSKEQPQAKC